MRKKEVTSLARRTSCGLGHRGRRISEPESQEPCTSVQEVRQEVAEKESVIKVYI